jgi:hypothetical protein
LEVVLPFLFCAELRHQNVRFKVFTAVTMQNGVFWDVIVPPKRRFLQEPHNVTSQETAFFNKKNAVCLGYDTIFKDACKFALLRLISFITGRPSRHASNCRKTSSQAVVGVSAQSNSISKACCVPLFRAAAL